MKSLNTVLGLLIDEKWHNIQDISIEISLPRKELDTAISFLKHMGTLEVKEEKERVKITDFGKEIFELSDDK
ncbi:MAG: hypothetical protein ACLFUR_05980 [Candidatus Hadarchaeia archaeon]